MEQVDDQQHNQWTPGLSEEDLQDLLADHLASRWCCYPSSALKSVLLAGVVHTEAFVYTLVSWYEHHSVQDRFAPYLGGRLDGRLEGDPPDTWDLKRPLPEAFSEAECLLTLPHTEEAFACPRCYGVGYAACRRCRRKGSVACHGCRGGERRRGGGGVDVGVQGDEESSSASSTSTATTGIGSVGGVAGGGGLRCLVCSGRGAVRCPACRGRAVGIECVECVGSGRLKRYQLVQVTWTVAVDYVVLNCTDLPSHKLTEADGYTVLRQVGPQLRLDVLQQRQQQQAVPLCLALACEFLVSRHQSLVDGATRLLLQRHSIRRIPLCVCDFGWPVVPPRRHRRQQEEEDDDEEAATAAETDAPEDAAAGAAATVIRRRHRLYVYGLSRRVHLERSGKTLLCGLRAAVLQQQRRGRWAPGSGGRLESLASACCLL